MSVRIEESEERRDCVDELLMERYALAKERVCEIKEEQVVQQPYLDFFQKTAVFLEKNIEIMDEVVFLGTQKAPRKVSEPTDLSLEEWKALNRELYQDILPENYENSYGNPVYACEKLGEFGRDLTFLYAELRGAVAYSHEKKLWDMTVLLELFLEVYGSLCPGGASYRAGNKGNPLLLCERLLSGYGGRAYQGKRGSGSGFCNKDCYGC